DSWWVERVQIMLHLSGFPDSVTAHRAATLLLESPPTASGPSVTAPLFVGLLAAAEGRWDDAQSMAATLDSIASAIPDVNGIPMGRRASEEAAALRAYVALVNEGVHQLAAMDSALARASSLSIISPLATLRWMVGNHL